MPKNARGVVARKGKKAKGKAKPPRSFVYDEDNHMHDGNVPFHLTSRGLLTIPTDSYMKPNRRGIRNPKNTLTLREKRFRWQRTDANDVMYGTKPDLSTTGGALARSSRDDRNKALSGKSNNDAAPGSYEHSSAIGPQSLTQWRNNLGLKFETAARPSPADKTPGPGPTRLPPASVVSYGRGIAKPSSGTVRFATSKRRPLYENDNDAEVRYDLDRIYPKMRAGVGLAKAGRCKLSAADLNRSPGCVYNQDVINFRSGHMGSDFGRSAGRNGVICNIDASHI